MAERAQGERLRGPFQYFGGKGHMVARLLPLIPSRKVYCEPFCGSASIFFAKEPSPSEVLNDLNGDIINFFRVMQDRVQFEELRHRLMWTPYSRAEFAKALEEPGESPADRAWALFVRQNQGYSGRADSVGNWGRSFGSTGGVQEGVNRWLMRLSMLDAWRWRLMRTVIDNRDALEVIRYWDSPDTVFYLDPPYVPSTRVSGGYHIDVDVEFHYLLVETLLTLQGAAALSGYLSEVYRPLETAGWTRHEFKTSCSAAGRTRRSKLRGKGAATKEAPRIEVLWVWDPSPTASLPPASSPLPPPPAEAPQQPMLPFCDPLDVNNPTTEAEEDSIVHTLHTPIP